MGYAKIVQYANVTEIYSYEKNLPTKKPSTLKALRLQKNGVALTKKLDSYRSKNVKKLRAIQRKSKEKTKRTERSIKRSRDNFFRLCNHNNYLAKSIHFVTLTFAYDISYKAANEATRRFFDRIKAAAKEVSISYISVPELTKKGRFHFHLLIYNLPTEISGDAIYIRTYDRKTKKTKVVPSTTERYTRNLQRKFGYGYVDICPATYTSKGIAGYMAKYLAKSFEDSRYETVRGYNCSRNIEKFREAKGSAVYNELETLTPDQELVEVKESKYTVPYMGECSYKKITTLIT